MYVYAWFCCCNYFKQTSKSHSKNRLFKYSDVRKCKYLVESNEHTKDWSKKKNTKQTKNKVKCYCGAQILTSFRSSVGVRYDTCNGKKCAHTTLNVKCCVNKLMAGVEKNVSIDRSFSSCMQSIIHVISYEMSKCCFALIAGPY